MSASRSSFDETLRNQKDMFVATEEILLIQNVERYKEVHSELRCLSTRENVSSSLL